MRSKSRTTCVQKSLPEEDMSSLPLLREEQTGSAVSRSLIPGISLLVAAACASLPHPLVFANAAATLTHTSDVYPLLLD